MAKRYNPNENNAAAAAALTDQGALSETFRCLRCDHFGYGGFKGGRSKQW